VKDHEYFAYIVCSCTGTLYIGMTNSIYRRMLEHKRGEVEGFAGKYHCDRLIYYEGFVHKAIGREKQLKGWIPGEKDCSHRIEEPAMGRFGGEVGIADGVCRRGDYGAMRELLDGSVLAPTGMGSPSAGSGQAFDCVSVRFTNGNFAQDDRLH
jgi:putative endonuclease